MRWPSASKRSATGLTWSRIGRNRSGITSIDSSDLPDVSGTPFAGEIGREVEVLRAGGPQDHDAVVVLLGAGHRFDVAGREAPISRGELPGHHRGVGHHRPVLAEDGVRAPASVVPVV